MNDNFNELAKKATNARLKQRYLALAHFQDNRSRSDIAIFLKVSRTSVNKWVSQYLKYGIDGLVAKKQSGRPQKLSKNQQQKLSEYIKQGEQSQQGGRLTGSDIQHYILAEFNVEYHLATIYRLLERLGFSWITSRSRHPKQSDETQDSFKKIQNKNDPQHSDANFAGSR